jgi:D-serine deaminase-like pyridoxal phosphate-dependent protein
VSLTEQTAAHAERRLGKLAAHPHVRATLDLVGRPGSRAMLATPALLVDLDALEANIERAARAAADAGVGLHPQAKAHKSSAIALLQLDAGADGISVATLGEAEALWAAGISPLLVTSPIHLGLLDRVASLHREMGDGLQITIDHAGVIEPLARCVSGGLGVLIDLDVGLHRTGILDGDIAARAAAQIEAAPSLQFLGVQAYGGHWQHIADRRARRDAVVEGMERAVALVERIERVAPVARRTGGGTGTFVDDCRLRFLNDLQPGSYVFMDRQYNEALAGDPDHGWEQSLFVRSTVVSANHGGWVTIDAGLKALATDASEPTWSGGSPYAWFGDEHGVLGQPEAGPRLTLGDQVELVPPHCDPTVDRYDVLHLVRGDTLVDVVAIDARGRTQ